MRYTGHFGGAGAYGGAEAGYGATVLPPKAVGRRRMNVVAVGLNVFVPWVLFCLVMAMLSFETHYKKPELCHTLLIITMVVLALVALLDILYIWWRRSLGEGGLADPSWLLFLCVSSAVAVSIGVVAGNRNFWLNMERFYDITALNSYNGVDPARMRGQEIMDAGRVVFAKGVHLDLNKSMGFRNMQMYCVAPIASGGAAAAAAGDAPPAAYDFWAVGTDCCSGSAADFQCGAWDDSQARGGVRVVRDEERAFYRLAVQQAQSAYAIKAVHPLFFHWVADPTDETYGFQQEAFRAYLVAMFAYFGFQLLEVYVAAQAFYSLLDPCAL